MEKSELLWKASIEEIVEGCKRETKQYSCTFCGERYNVGQIYKIGEQLYDAYGAVQKHCQMTHGLAIDYLLDQEPALLGISEVQQQILKLMSQGKDDRYIAHEIGIAQSTVRNHRFKLREKEKQAKLYLAMMQSLEDKTKRAINETDQGVIEEVHLCATMVDDRYGITEKEREKAVKAYMDENGGLLQFPAREKKKIIILGEIMKNFMYDKTYSEKEVNMILKRIYEDYPTIRRALIEYGFLERSDDCKVYRVKE